MKRLIYVSCIVGISLSIFACSTMSKEISMRMQSSQSDIFSEVANVASDPGGASYLTISANIKIPEVGYYLLHSSESQRANEGYPFLINIDGQSVTWKITGFKDHKPEYDSEGHRSKDPEASDGMKFILNKTVKLSPGQHKVFIGLPEEEYFKEIAVAIKEGEISILDFKPTYRRRSRPEIETFLKGIKRYDVYLNGQLIS